MHLPGQLLPKVARLVVGILAAFAMTAAAPGLSVAGETAGQTVRVGYALYPGYQEGGANEYKTGFGYEYLQKLAGITGWRYEYVYGSFNELLEKLRKGEIDLMGDLTITSDREDDIAFGLNEQGQENYYLYINRKHPTIDEEDYSTINGKKIGVYGGMKQRRLWEDWCKRNHIRAELIEFQTVDARQKALNDGTIDAVIATAVVRQDEVTADWDPVMSFGSAPFYFGVNIERPDLLMDLDEAQKKILDENPSYNVDVYSRHVTSRSVSQTNLSLTDRERLEKSNNLVRVGYLNWILPLSGENKEGHFCGVAHDLLDAVEKTYSDSGLRFESIGYSDYGSMLAALAKGEVEAVWPFYNDYWNADQNHVALTDSVLSNSVMLVFKGNYTADTVKRLGINRHGLMMRTFAHVNYPDSEVVELSTKEEALEALRTGKITAILYLSSIFNVDEQLSSEFDEFSSVTLPASVGLSFAVKKGDDGLAAVFNKGLRAVGRAGITHSLIENSVVQKEFTLREYFARNPVEANTIVGLIFLLLSGLAIGVVWRESRIRVRASRAEKDMYARLAKSDVLTGLPNRRAYEEVLQDWASVPLNHEKAVLTVVDISGTKRANIAGGRQSGDKLIVAVGEALKAMFGDDVYRISGDSFGVVDPDGRYMALLEDPSKMQTVFEDDGQIYQFGHGSCPLRKDDGSWRTAYEWKRDADIMLYHNKLYNKAAAEYTEDEKLHAFIEGVGAVVDARDEYTGHHSDRVQKMSVFIAVKLGLSEVSVRLIGEAARLHDIGKIGIHDAVLQKPGRLTDAEFAEMKSHPEIGSNLLSNTVGMLEIANIIRHHHERYDGKGYPDGLAGEEIPLESRVIAVADSIDAMTSSRCYRKALTPEVCYAEVKRNLGVMYDPAIGQIVLNYWDEIEAIIRDYAGEETETPQDVATHCFLRKDS